jgi:transketolase N-terminal domain/subunit
MFVLTYKSGVYCLTADQEMAEVWSSYGMSVTELDAEDFSAVNTVADILEEENAESVDPAHVQPCP